MTTPTLFPFLASVVTSAIGGGAINAWLTHHREKRKTEGDLHRTGFEVLAAAWQQEHARLVVKIDHLEDIVVALSDEIIQLGGDPLRVRACLRTKPTSNQGNPHTGGE